MKAAKKAIIRAVQGLGFYKELLSLRTVQREVKKSSSIVKLDPGFVEGIICVGGRLHNSAIKKEAKHPVILLKDHHVSEPTMHHYHLISGNSGLEHTPSLIRQKYWIIQVRIPLCHILNLCFDCRRRQAAVGQQKMANLPDNRVTPLEPPFSCVGVDCFGPLDVCWGRSTVKWYGVLFTCLSIWAIHIEVAHSLDTDSFIDALLMHSFCAEGDESSHEGRAFRWPGFADSNLWSTSDYQRLIHNQSNRWPQWSWSPHAQLPVVIAIRTYLTPWLVQQRR